VKRRHMAALLVIAWLVSSACAREPKPATQTASPRSSPQVTVKPSPSVTAETSPSLTPTSSPEVVWEGSPEFDPSGDVPIDEFNAYLESAQPPWASSPLRTALEFLSLDDPDARTTTVVMETGSPEGGDQAVVTVTEDGLADDSVRALRFVLKVERQADGGWRLLSAVWSQRCQGGRGHQQFTPELCV
jgi:hypothetical protein